jgi:RHS repeat-associated protein
VLSVHGTWVRIDVVRPDDLLRGERGDAELHSNGIGNLTSRSDVGTYTYPTSGQGVARPHTPTSIAAAGGAPFALTTTFTYDADGNMLTGAGRTATWTSFAMPATISLGGQELRWLYGPERQRIRETLTGAAHTLHVAGFAGAYWERRLNVTTNVATVTNYLSFGGETVALVTETSTSPGVITTLWQLKDHLGSTTTLLDASGLISGTRKSYDVWGKRRHVTGEDDTTNSIVSASSRDFTGHEFLEELRLVHMGGRIYDPVVARFLSPDPFVQDPFNLQNLNRYSYVLNNPLAYTDPDGFFFKSISKAFGKLQRFFQRTPIAALAVGIGVAAVTGCWFGFDLFTIQGAVIAGSVSGALTDGLRGAIFGAVSGAVTFGIGELGLGFLGDAQLLGKAGLHGIAQGALAEARGGEFVPAFLAASFAHAAGSGLGKIDALKGDGFEKLAARTVAAAVVGGTASVIGGGKFQNGAFTGAFVHLFNFESHWILRSLVPGQIAYDKMVTSLEQGDYGTAALNAVEWFGETALSVLPGSQLLRGGQAVRALPTELNWNPITPQYVDNLAKSLVDWGGGIPRSVPTAKGATQFIFPNSNVMRFDIRPGQYLPTQQPHINLQRPGTDLNRHIDVLP